MKSGARITELDGLRGLAILLVIGFHYYAARPDLLPFGSRFSDVFVFKYGSLGVELFFMISGYVIFMSLDASKGLLSFARKRWLRLFPAMLIVTIGVLLTAPLLAERPLGLPRLVDAIPGITFVEASWYRDILGVDVLDLEGAFWSLYVEVRFYILLGVLYFTLGRRKAAAALGAILLAANILKALMMRGTIGGPAANMADYILSEILIAQHLAWFLIGILTYLASRKELGRWGYLILIPTVSLALLHMRIEPQKAVAALVLTIIFLAVMWHGKLRSVFRWRLFAFMGAVSYPLYLFHENAGIALIIKAARVSILPSFILPILVLVALAGIAYVIAAIFEPLLHDVLRRLTAAKPPTLPATSAAE